MSDGITDSYKVPSEMRDMDAFAFAVELWGIDFQSDMVVEECSELIKAIMKAKRYGAFNGKHNSSKMGEDMIRDIVEEAVDVHIMLGQIKHMITLSLIHI